MNIASIMNRQVATAEPGESFERILAAMRDMPSRLLHVVDESGRLQGVISSYDVLNTVLPFYMDSNLAKAVGDDEDFAVRLLAEKAHLTARDIMVSTPLTLREDSHLLEAEALVKEREINALPILDANGRVVGEVTRQDILSRLIELCARSRQCKQ